MKKTFPVSGVLILYVISCPSSRRMSLPGRRPASRAKAAGQEKMRQSAGLVHRSLQMCSAGTGWPGSPPWRLKNFARRDAEITSAEVSRGASPAASGAGVDGSNCFGPAGRYESTSPCCRILPPSAGWDRAARGVALELLSGCGMIFGASFGQHPATPGQPPCAILYRNLETRLNLFEKNDV